MKKNVNINTMPIVRVEVSQAPVSVSDWAKSEGLKVAAAAATALATGIVTGLCAKMFRTQPKKKVNTSAVDELIVEDESSTIQDC